MTDDVVIVDTAGQALDIFLHGPEARHKNGIAKIHSHPPMHTIKTKSKTLNSQNMMHSFSCPLPVQCGGGDSQEAWQMLLRSAPSRRPALLDIVLHFRLLVLFLSSVLVVEGQVASHLLLRAAPHRKTFVDVFNKYSNID